ncbi:hypothetical protein RRS04_004838 [Klebsiella aerogenes]|uniref:hypothetical protein n=1 Tax=Klebsiella aerogenes TaxID=548 RepID=UPI00063CCA29|nr:hypothetical protein [Klebsiella aerogenes]ELI7202111.1 hypothetical protein [Klebsiella aerogenes]KLF02097.1 hypothetical protein YA24_12990 [Klebsiella aerogenes]
MQKESRTDRWLRTGFVLFIVVLILLIVFNGTAKTSDVSNWIIAFANIAMAAAAVGAWRAARKFLSEFFAQEGYRLAIALINENVIHLGIDNEYTVRAQEAIVVCRQLHGEAHTDDKLTLFRQKLDQLIALHGHHSIWLRNSRSLSFRMETYGIYAAEGKKAALAEMMIALDSMVQQGDILVSLLRKDFGVYEQKIKRRVDFHLPFRSEHLAEMEKTLQSINDEWNLMVSCRNKLLSEGKHARTLFVVKES